MTSPTDNMVPPCPVVGNQDGDKLRREEELAVLALLELKPPHRVSVPCYQCGKESEFLAQFEMANGWWGCCLGCGEERLVPYTRTVSTE
jgi:hypothetical protein